MCNRYVSPQEAAIERLWQIGRHNNNPWRGGSVFPRGQGPFIRRGRHDSGYGLELAIGQWGLIPWFAKSPKLAYSTNNARSEELASKASFRDPWARGQRCIIPADSFDEPCWETGKNVWVDKATGEEVESYTMLTVNADAHPIMSRMHKPDPKLPPDQQDKRSVIAIELEDVDLWLQGTIDQARALLQPPAPEVFEPRST
ncbi:SOS response-associated peptidase family protein [Leptospira sp. 96542]|nr:SOS response-associated peptidase family protein [Leptospira sp. 96542]